MNKPNRFWTEVFVCVFFVWLVVSVDSNKKIDTLLHASTPYTQSQKPKKTPIHLGIQQTDTRHTHSKSNGKNV